MSWPTNIDKRSLDLAAMKVSTMLTEDIALAMSESEFYPMLIDVAELCSQQRLSGGNPELLIAYGIALGIEIERDRIKNGYPSP